MFPRISLEKLKSWRAGKQRKPLILRGARQVGKTTLIKMFAEHYPHAISLNLDIKKDRAIFEQANDVETLVSRIFFEHQLPKAALPETLLFIDEIQSSPQAVNFMRYFYEQIPELNVIAAGSLLETLINTHISFPVGRVTYLFLYPLTFIEYLHAVDKIQALSVLAQHPVPSYAHDELLQLFYEYTLIGGMPEIVADYATHHDLARLNTLYRDLLITYQDDVEKYAKSENLRTIIRHCIMRAPLEIAKRIKFEGFGSSNYPSKEIKTALTLLEKAMIMHLMYPTTSIDLPIMPNFNRSPRVQFLDTGLVNAAVGLQAQFIEMQTLDSIYQGRIAEHIVAQELIATGLLPNENFNFWIREKKQSSAEVDFVIAFENKLIPIEVKAGKTGKLKSLHQFINQAPHDLAVRIYSGPFSIEQHKTPEGKAFTLLNLPFYLTHQIKNYLENLRFNAP